MQTRFRKRREVQVTHQTSASRREDVFATHRKSVKDFEGTALVWPLVAYFALHERP